MHILARRKRECAKKSCSLAEEGIRKSGGKEAEAYSFKKSEAPSSRGISLERLNDLNLVRGPVWDPWEPTLSP